MRTNLVGPEHCRRQVGGRLHLLVVLAVAVWLPLVATAANARSAPTTPSSAPVVTSEAPLLPPRTITLVEEWRAGGEDGDIFFGMVVGTVADGEGNVYVLDSQLAQVEVFAPDGAHLRTLGGEGDGPGEVRAPQAVSFLSDGTLGIVKFFPGEIVRLTPDGIPQTSIHLTPAADGGKAQTGEVAAFGMECRGGTLLVAGQRSVPSEVGSSRRHFLARFSSTGEELVRYREHDMELDFNAFRFVESTILPAFLLTSAVSPDGEVYTPAGRDRYAVEVYAADGALERVIERRDRPRRRTDRERRRMNALVDAWGQGIPYEVPREFDVFEPPITELFVDRDGILWVQHARSGFDQKDGVFLTYDTFDRDGRWLQEVSVVAEGDPTYDGVKFLDDGRALLIKGYVLARWASRGARNATFDEDEEPGAIEIIGCRVVD
ncbi:MAG: hypothetical protein R6X25_15135 [Candidatus Krumholzibacteriia bacterium]